MKKFFTQACIFILPYLAVFLIIGIIDPYDYFGKGEIITKTKKEAISKKINYALWKVIEFGQKPPKNIILGDSRTNLLDINEVQKITNKEYYNLSYGGGTLNEICTTFWYATQKTQLENVYIGISFNIYNKSKSYDRVSSALAIINNPILYLVNRDVLYATYLLIKTKFQDKIINIEKPPMTRDKFWQYQLDVSARKELLNYSYPETMKNELFKIVNHCKRNNIKLYFIIMPSHQDLHEKIKSYMLEKEYKQFKHDLSQMGPVYDFDTINQYNTDRNNFRDPYHITKEYGRIIVDQIWANKVKVSGTRKDIKKNEFIN